MQESDYAVYKCGQEIKFLKENTIFIRNRKCLPKQGLYFHKNQSS